MFQIHRRLFKVFQELLRWIEMMTNRLSFGKKYCVCKETKFYNQDRLRHDDNDV